MRRPIIASVALALSLGAGSTLATEQEEPPASGAFEPAGSLAEGRADHAATLLPDGRVLIVGAYATGISALAEVWDPETASFGPAGSLAKARAAHTATLLPNGRVLIVGGEYDLGSAEVWEPGDG